MPAIALQGAAKAIDLRDPRHSLKRPFGGVAELV